MAMLPLRQACESASGSFSVVSKKESMRLPGDSVIDSLERNVGEYAAQHMRICEVSDEESKGSLRTTYDGCRCHHV